MKKILYLAIILFFIPALCFGAGPFGSAWHQNADGTYSLPNSTDGIDVGSVSAGGAAFDTDLLYVDSANDKIGIGTTTPGAKLDIRDGALWVIKSSGDVEFILGEGVSANQFGGMMWDESINKLVILTQGNAKQLVLDLNKNVSIGTTEFGSGGSGTLIIANGTAQTTPPVDASVFYAKDVSSSSEIFVIDEAGNEIQLSAHATDAPDWLYDWDIDSQPPNIIVEINKYAGQVRYTNRSRADRLKQMEWLGQTLPADPLKKTIIHTETFEQHNARNGYVEGDSSYLVQLNWDDVQAYHVNARQAEITAKQAEIAAIDTKLFDTQLATKEAVDLIAERDAIVIPVEYIKKVKPAWVPAKAIEKEIEMPAK